MLKQALHSRDKFHLVMVQEIQNSVPLSVGDQQLTHFLFTYSSQCLALHIYTGSALLGMYHLNMMVFCSLFYLTSLLNFSVASKFKVCVIQLPQDFSLHESFDTKMFIIFYNILGQGFPMGQLQIMSAPQAGPWSWGWSELGWVLFLNKMAATLH